MVASATQGGHNHCKNILFWMAACVWHCSALHSVPQHGDLCTQIFLK